jgi:hypothetical protein
MRYLVDAHHVLGRGPDRSVDFRPLGPIVVGAAALLVIWVLTIFIAALAAHFHDDDPAA